MPVIIRSSVGKNTGIIEIKNLRSHLERIQKIDCINADKELLKQHNNKILH